MDLACIHLSYQLHYLQPPTAIRAHSTFSLSISIAFLNDVPIANICKVATWAWIDTFACHYAITNDTTADTLLGHAVLSSGANVAPKPQPSN